MTLEQLHDYWKLSKQAGRGVAGGVFFWGTARTLEAIHPYYKGNPETYEEAQRYVQIALNRCREGLDETLEELRARTAPKRPRDV